MKALLSSCVFLGFVACDSTTNEKSGVSNSNLSYVWSIDKPEGSGDVFRPSRVGAELIPDIAGDYYLKLEINEGKKDHEPELITIKVTSNSIGGGSEGNTDTFSFNIGNIKERSFIDKNDPEEEYPFAWAPYPIPFKSDVYEDDIFLRMSFKYEEILSSIDIYVDGTKEGIYDCGDNGVEKGETYIFYEDETKVYNSNDDGSCKITVSKFSPKGRLIGRYEATVTDRES